MTKLRLLVGLILGCTMGTIFAQSAAILDEKDVEKFIETLGPMSEELKWMGYNVNAENSEDILEFIEVQTDVRNVVRKYGWNPDSVGDKWVTIALCYAELKMLDMLSAEGNEEYADVVLESAMHPQDLELVKKHQVQLEALFQMKDS